VVRPQAVLLLFIAQNVKLPLRIIEGVAELHTKLLSLLAPAVSPWPRLGVSGRMLNLKRTLLLRAAQRLPELDESSRQPAAPAKRIVSAVNLTPENRLRCLL
jgi:hypothetical protein